jgi:hypothetical protein
MRYTTIIDIRDLPAVYHNINARIIYLHLALKAGYHDADRDLVDISIRTLAAETGCSVSATRHALAVLVKNRLLSRTGPLWSVTKWLQEGQITARKRSQKQQQALEAEAARRAENEARERQNEVERLQRENLEKQGKTSFMIWYEALLTKAAAGDADAARQCERHRKTYEQHKAQAEARAAVNENK